MTRRVAQPSESGTGRLFTIPEAAAYVRLSRTTLYALMNDGLLNYVKIRKARRIPLAALTALVERNTRTGAGETE